MALFAFVFLVLVLGFFAMRDISGVVADLEDGQADIENGQVAARERGYAQAAHICMSEIISATSHPEITPDQIRENIGSFCAADVRLAYFIPTICEQIFPDNTVCGSKVDQPVL